MIWILHALRAVVGSVATLAVCLVSPPGWAQVAGSAQGDQGTSASENLTEIIVTAQKRSEKLVDVPISITAIGGPRLETLQVTQLSDLQGYVPGLSVINGGAPGINTISIRGLSSGYQS